MKKQSKFQTWLKSFYASDEELAAYELSEQSATRNLLRKIGAAESAWTRMITRNAITRKLQK